MVKRISHARQAIYFEDYTLDLDRCLLLRDGKPGYMHDVPRTLSYIVDIAPRHDELSFLADLISNRILPVLDKAD